MCYENDLQHKGVRFFISDCSGVGFRWKDEAFVKAVENRDDAIWGILEWAANGGAATYNNAAEFESDLEWVSERRQLESLKRMKVSELQALLDNPYLTARCGDLIRSFFDGSLEKAVREDREREKAKPKTNPRTAGYVYLILAENGLYKIGKARDVKSRLKPFTVAFPMKWDLVHSFKSADYSIAEAKLHEKFADKRDVGEWFKLSSLDAAYFCSIQDGQL